MQIIRFSVWDNLFANFVNCRFVLDIFLQIIELIVLDFFYRFCELLFQTKFYCKKIPGLGERLVILANMVIHTSESWALGSILLLSRICNSKYLTLIGSLWTPGGEGGGLFLRYFSLSKETIWQFFSSLLSSQSWNGRELLERTEQIQ